MNLHELELIRSSYNHQYDSSLIDPDAPVMISYWSFQHGHACPAINYFKVTFFGTFIIWSESFLYFYLVAVCAVSCCWPKFQSTFNPCNPLQQTTTNIINIMPKYSLEQLFLEFSWSITFCTDGRDTVDSADKGMKVFDTGQFDFSWV